MYDSCSARRRPQRQREEVRLAADPPNAFGPSSGQSEDAGLEWMDARRDGENGPKAGRRVRSIRVHPRRARPAASESLELIRVAYRPV